MILGITGGICTGKSTATETLRTEGVRVVDCDEIAHYLGSYSPRVLEAIRLNFGPGFFRPQGALDRSALAQVVFGDAMKRRDLEHILHPPIWAVVEENVEYARGRGLPLAVVVPLLFETSRATGFDHIWVISCSRETQIERFTQRSGLTREQAEMRIDAQLPSAEKARLADTVIENEGSIEEFRVEILKQWSKLLGYGN